MTDYQLALRRRGEATAISLRVVPRSRRPGLDGLRGQALRLRVSAPPADGKANAEAVRLLASLLGVRPRDVTIDAGGRSRDKTVLVHGLRPEEVATRLEHRS